MTPLADRTTEALAKQGYQFEQQELEQLLRQLDIWQIDRSTPELQLVRSFEFKDFAQALDFTNRIGGLAEQANHHPSILLEWGKVSVRWWTHSTGGLHINDFILAARTDRVFTEK